MGWRDWGSVPVNSRGGASTGFGIETNPSSATLIAEIDSTALRRIVQTGAVQVTWMLGCSTNAIWVVEQATSTNLASTSNIVDRAYIQTPANQTGQYILTYKVNQGDRLRARLDSAITGVATCKISAEPLT